MNDKDKTDLDGKIDPSYYDQNATPLSIEVVANPATGAYDLKLTQ